MFLSLYIFLYKFVYFIIFYASFCTLIQCSIRITNNVVNIVRNVGTSIRDFTDDNIYIYEIAQNQARSFSTHKNLCICFFLYSIPLLNLRNAKDITCCIIESLIASERYLNLNLLSSRAISLKLAHSLSLFKRYSSFFSSKCRVYQIYVCIPLVLFQWV